MRVTLYGNGDKSEKTGFPCETDFVNYIKGGIFSTFNGRYRYSQQRIADIILLGRAGKAYGYFVISDIVEPSEQDKELAKNPKKVYLVNRSVAFENPVTLKPLGIEGYQFGKSISHEQFDNIKKLGGANTVFLPSE